MPPIRPLLAALPAALIATLLTAPLSLHAGDDDDEEVDYEPDPTAGAVILREVGGQCLRLDGGDWQLGESELLAGHPKLLEEVVKVLAAGRE